MSKRCLFFLVLSWLYFYPVLAMENNSWDVVYEDFDGVCLRTDRGLAFQHVRRTDHIGNVITRPVQKDRLQQQDPNTLHRLASCGHELIKEYLRERIRNYFQNYDSSFLSCPYCGELLTKSDAKELNDHQLDYSLVFENALKRAKAKCSLCSYERGLKKRYRLSECGHDFCKKCLEKRMIAFADYNRYKEVKRFCELYGKDPYKRNPEDFGNEELLKCPEPGCTKKIIQLDVTKFAPKYSAEFLAAKKKECSICLESVPFMNFYALSSCHHEFCKRCLVEQFKNAKKYPIDTQFVCCPALKCGKQLKASDVEKFFDDNKKQSAEEFTNLLLRQLFMQNSEAFKECPNEHCHYVYAVNADDAPQNVQCLLCKKKFCSQCRREHAVMTSDQHSEYIKSIEANDEANAEWVANNIRLCPNDNCKKRIEKISGCDNVKCSMCGTVFCFVCGKNFGVQGPHYMDPDHRH